MIEQTNDAEQHSIDAEKPGAMDPTQGSKAEDEPSLDPTAGPPETDVYGDPTRGAG
jgi:hypothetical protein